MSHQERYEDQAKDYSKRQSFQLEPEKELQRDLSGIKGTQAQESKATTSLSSIENQTRKKDMLVVLLNLPFNSLVFVP